MTRSERGSATIHVLFAAVLLFTALGIAILWSSISTARHKLTAAADLTALSAAQSLTEATGELAPTQPESAQPALTQPQQTAAHTPAARPEAARARSTPCAAAARAAALNGVQLRACDATAAAVTVEVSLELDLRLTRPTLTAGARAGPV